MRPDPSGRTGSLLGASTTARRRRQQGGRTLGARSRGRPPRCFPTLQHRVRKLVVTGFGYMPTGREAFGRIMPG